MVEEETPIPSVRDVISATSLYGGHRSAHSEIRIDEDPELRELERRRASQSLSPAAALPPVSPLGDGGDGDGGVGGGGGADDGADGGIVPVQDGDAPPVARSTEALPVLVPVSLPREPPVQLLGSAGALYSSLRSAAARGVVVGGGGGGKKPAPKASRQLPVRLHHAETTYGAASAALLRRPRKAPTARASSHAPALAPIPGVGARGVADARAAAIDDAIAAAFKTWSADLAEHQLQASNTLREQAAVAERLGRQYSVERKAAVEAAVSKQTIDDARRLRLSHVESRFKNIVARWSRNQTADAWGIWRMFTAKHRAHERWVARVSRQVIKIQTAFRHHRCAVAAGAARAPLLPW